MDFLDVCYMFFFYVKLIRIKRLKWVNKVNLGWVKLDNRIIVRFFVGRDSLFWVNFYEL